MSKEKLFGTDGIRGKINQWPMTAEMALRVGMAAGSYFTRGSHRHKVVIGKDTRLSGYMLEPALTAGFTSVGMDVVLVGPIPTPAIAMLTRSLRCDIGVMLTASHNPYHDNGIKLFGPDGFKLSDEIEKAIEKLVASNLDDHQVQPDKIGRASRLDDAPGRYIESVKGSLSDRLSLNDLKIVVDCANGAAYKVAPTVLWELGADVIPIGVSPDGFNINRDCGSVHSDALARRVVDEGADIGIALDGDADRVVLADEKGKIIDGDQVMAAIAERWHQRGMLHGGAVVATVMSNLGLERFLKERGLGLTRTKVGDRHVVEEMRRSGCNLGGEQSGHIVMSDYANTGDGLIASLQILSLTVRADRPVSEVCRRFAPVPQILENVRYQNGTPLEHPSVTKLIEGGREQLGDSGRIVIRASGTEPVIRIMAEGDDETVVRTVVDSLTDAIAAVAT